MKTDDINLGTDGQWSPKMGNDGREYKPINGHSTIGKMNPSTKRRLMGKMAQHGNMIINAGMTGSLESRDIKGAYVNLERYKPRNYNHMDYSDVTHEKKGLKLQASDSKSSGMYNLKGVQLTDLQIQ